MRKTRNYWAHQCFGGNQPIIFIKDKLKRDIYGEKIVSDLEEAIEWDKKLTEIGKQII